MKTMSKTVLAAIIAATPAFAGTGKAAGSGLLMSAFLGFGALIIAFQFVPAVLLFGSMLKGLFSAEAPKESAAKK